MDKSILKQKTERIIDENRNLIISIGEKIYTTPETGFKEYKTTELIENEFKKLNLAYTIAGNIPGLKATIDTGRPGPGIAVMGELDAILCSTHPHCNKETGAVHACGHNIQTATMLGAAIGLSKSGVLDSLSGKIHFIAVPAEEYIEIDYRMNLREKGIIRFMGGKPEFLSRGLLDDVDICMLLHAYGNEKKVGVCKSTNGCIVKKIRYIGKASHAGAAPHAGINALYAANLGLSAINSLRETFPEKDTIRVHPIITKGGEIVNVIPDDVHMETFVRGRTLESIMKTNKKVNRAHAGSAISMGAKVEIEDLPGYFPLTNDTNLINILKSIAGELTDNEEILMMGHTTGSTDAGDLSSLIPVLHPTIAGTNGLLHSADFKITDPDISYVLGSKILANMVLELLCNNSESAKDIIAEYKPYYKSKDEYLENAEKLFNKKLFSEDDDNF